MPRQVQPWDKSGPETCPAPRHFLARKYWPLLNDLYLLYIIYKCLFVGLSCIEAMMEQIVVHSFLLASLALLASLYCIYWILCIGFSSSGLFCLASSLRFKVHIFWEGHKILRNLPLTFDRMYCSQKLEENFAKILWTSQNIWTLLNSTFSFSIAETRNIFLKWIR